MTSDNRNIMFANTCKELYNDTITKKKEDDRRKQREANEKTKQWFETKLNSCKPKILNTFVNLAKSGFNTVG
jgi:hypothetical protein